jgi:hypothetical protein
MANKSSSLLTFFVFVTVSTLAFTEGANTRLTVVAKNVKVLRDSERTTANPAGF